MNFLVQREAHIRKIANRVGHDLLREEPDAAYSALVGVAALINCDPDVDKENPLSLARDFGTHVLEEVERSFDHLSSVRRKLEQQSEGALA